jgi:hypothetical protein
LTPGSRNTLEVDITEHTARPHDHSVGGRFVSDSVSAQSSQEAGHAEETLDNVPRKRCAQQIACIGCHSTFYAETMRQNNISGGISKQEIMKGAKK